MTRIAAVLAILLLILIPVIAKLGVDKEKPTQMAGEPELGEGYAYHHEALLRFRELVRTPRWALADPPRNEQGMLETVHEKTGLRFALIPAGEFTMGSPQDEVGRWEAEGPVHRVRLNAFLLSTTECTQEAWKRGGGQNSSDFKGADRPIEEVSWTECHEWCELNGLGLPSEAEWEYACRAGTLTMFSWGNNWDPSKCMLENYEDSNQDKGVEYYRRRGLPVNAAAAVRQFAGNPWGLHDMHGNVFEWCEDTWRDDYEGAPTDGSARTDDGSANHVLRGGSWCSTTQFSRSAFRNRGPPDHRSDYLGFRPAADLR